MWNVQLRSPKSRAYMYINYVRITIYILGWSNCEFHETQDKGGEQNSGSCLTLTQQRSTPFGSHVWAISKWLLSHIWASKYSGSITISGWWYTYPSEKYEFVSWDYYSQIYGKIKNVPNHQQNMYRIGIFFWHTWTFGGSYNWSSNRLIITIYPNQTSPSKTKHSASKNSVYGMIWAHDPICRSWYPLVTFNINLWNITIYI